MKNRLSLLLATSAVVLVGCAGSNNEMNQWGPVATPTVDYVEGLDVYSAPHKDSFLNQLAMNYRSYAIYNARTSGYSDMGELFANKAVAAFSGETPFPESLDNWPVDDEQTSFELYNAYNQLMDQLKTDAADNNPQLAAEAQAKFDCWLSATASGQMKTASQCRDRFQKTIAALADCKDGRVVNVVKATSVPSVETTIETTSVSGCVGGKCGAEKIVQTETYYPETRNMMAMNDANRAREGVIIVNNVNVPEHLINPVPVQPVVFNQNIYGGDKTITKSANDNRVRNSNNTVAPRDCPKDDKECLSAVISPVVIVEQETIELPCEQRLCPEGLPCPECAACQECEKCPENQPCPACQQCPEVIPMVSDELVTREEFINMMMAMRDELAAINARLDQIQAAQGEKTMIKVQQIPLTPQQHVMEEVFEIQFDFNKATIKPEYQELIKKLASATQENKNIKVSVVGHTDTAGTSNYNYALGGRRAEAVQKMLIQYGIPASQIVAVSAGEEDLAVPTPDNTPNAANRRVRVVKEVHYEEPAAAAPIAIEVQEFSGEMCGEYGCNK